MDKDKLANLRKKVAENKAKKHQELLDSNASIKDAITALKQAIELKEDVDMSVVVAEILNLKESLIFKEDIDRLTTAIEKQSNESVTPENINQLIDKIGDINNDDVIIAVNNLSKLLAENTTHSQKASDYMPVRRVRKVGQVFIFDDDPHQTTVMGGGGGGGVQTSLIRNNNSLAVVNTDGSSIGGLIPNQDFDYIDIQQTSATVETYVYKQGGVSGTTVQTITVTYTDSSKNDLDKVEYA